MAITDIVSDIAGVGPTANYTLGANTEAPYAGVSILALTDGSSAATASKNMAKIDNRYLFERRYTIEKAGLTYDPLDDSQFVRALQKLANYSPQSYGTFASVLAPTLAPTEANPQTILTNANQEVFAWTGTKWALIANGFIVANTGDPQIVLADGAYHVVNSIIVPRDGVVEIEAYVIFENAQAQAKYITIAFDVGFGQGFSGNTNVNPISPFDNLGVFGIKGVTAGQVIPLSVLVYTTNAPIKGSGITLTYTR
jgi:hypothetical protein